MRNILFNAKRNTLPNARCFKPDELIFLFAKVTMDKVEKCVQLVNQVNFTKIPRNFNIAVICSVDAVNLVRITW